MAHPAAGLQLFPRWIRSLVLASAGGVLLGILGPFGSYLNSGPLVRIFYWVASMWSGLALYGAGVTVSAKLAASDRRLFWAILVASVLVASVPQALLTRALAFALWPELARLGLSLGTWYAQVVTVGLLAVLGFMAAMRLLRDREVPVQSPPPSAVERPMPSINGDVLALQMEDHYVRIHTSAGSELVLMSLGRAIEAVSAIDGLRTHRSWWVARRAVKRVDGSPRAMTLHLTNGLVAPVSRSAVATLRAAGWLESTASKAA